MHSLTHRPIRSPLVLLVELALVALALASCAADAAPSDAPSARRPSHGDGSPPAAAVQPREGTFSVTAAVETEPVPHAGDAADDPAIWVDPDNPSGSLIIGTDKANGGGLAIYDLAGRQVAYQEDGATNNVDVRGDIVVAGNEAENAIAVYRLEPNGPRLVPLVGEPIEPGLTMYGTCLYRNAADATLYAFVTSERGEVEQWRLAEGPDGGYTGERVRRFELDSQTEACVADDEAGFVYFAEESTGIWRFPAEPDDTAEGTLLDRTGGDGNLEADVEGLAILRIGTEALLIASSQGSDRYVVYRLADGSSVATFDIEDGDVDGVTETDGLEVTTAPLGGRFAGGLLVVQDGRNDGDNQNFKLVPLDALFE